MRTAQTSDPDSNPDQSLSHGEASDENNSASTADGSPNSGERETQQSQDDLGGSAAGGETSGDTGNQDSQRPAAPPVAPKQDWRERRIAQQTARLREANEELERLRAENARLQGHQSQGQSEAETRTGAIYSGDDIQRLAEQRAAEIAAANEFNRACNDIAAKGRADFGDTEFNSRVGALRSLVNPADPREAANYNQFLSALIETGEAPRLIHQLGDDLDEASRILALSPVKMGIELAKLAARTPEPASGAPRPIRPVGGGRQASHTAIDPTDPDRADNLSTAEWMRRMDERDRARAQERVR